MSNVKEIQVLFYQDNDQIVAQGLEVDICGWGQTREAALQDFITSMVIEILMREKDGGCLDDIGPAPQKFLKFLDVNTGLHRVPVSAEGWKLVEEDGKYGLLKPEMS